MPKKRVVFVLFFIAFLTLISFSFIIVFAKSEKSEENNKVYSDPLCKHIKFQDKTTINNGTLQLCENQKEELKKALGKGRMKKPNGIDVKESRIIEKPGQGTIRFKDSFDVDSEDADEESGNANIYIGEGIVAINTDEVPELEQPATITLYNLSFESTPTIYYNEGFTTKLSEISKPCPANVCSNINYDNATGTLSFDVAQFSSYAAFQWSLVYDPSRPGGCSVDADCKPTAFCAKYLDCDASTYPEQCASSSYSYYGSNDLSLCGIPEFEQRCSYKPSAGTESLTCSLFTRYSKPCSLNLGNYCDEDFTYKKIQGGSYGDSWCMDVCEKTEACSTCEGTTACTRAYCASNSYASCLSNNCPPNINDCWFRSDCCPARSDCMKQASKSCLTSNVNFNPPESHWCQPRVCSSPTEELGKCSYTENNLNLFVKIGDSICLDKNIKICSNENNDPCGEWKQTTIGCNAERDETTGGTTGGNEDETKKECNDNTGTKTDYCLNQEILIKYYPTFSEQIYTVNLNDMYGYSSSSFLGITYPFVVNIQEHICNAIQINCTQSGMVCNSAKRACNTPPTASATLQPKNSSYPYVENGVPTSLSDLNCTIYLTDKDKEDKTLRGDYKVTIKFVDDNGNTQLATLMSGQDTCTKPLDNYGNPLSNSCAIQVPIILDVITTPGDIINCSALPYDGYDYGKSGSDAKLIKPNVVLSADKDYLESKRIDADEYLEPVKIEENGEKKSYLVVTEYDTLECSMSPIPPPLGGNIEFVLQGAKKQVQCGSECKAKFEVPEDVAGWPRGQKIQCTANVLNVGKSFQSNEVAVAQYVYYFVPINQLSYGDTKTEQYDYFTSLSQVNDRINLAGKAVYLKPTIIAPTTGLLRENRFLLRIKNSVKANVLNGDFDEEKDIITGIVSSTTARQMCSDSTACAVSVVLIVLISAEESSYPTIAHEFGHIIGKHADEYKLSTWERRQLDGHIKSPLGEDSTVHFPECCLWVCCREESDSSISTEWSLLSDCGSLVGHVSRMIVPDALCPSVSLPLSSCGTVENCNGMPYKDKEGNHPFDESYFGGGIDSTGSIMGDYNYHNLVYPQNSKCPLRNC